MKPQFKIGDEVCIVEGKFLSDKGEILNIHKCYKEIDKRGLCK